MTRLATNPNNSRDRERRDRPATEQAILDAFEHVLLRDGVRGLGVNSVAAEAGVNKVLIYRYFGDFPGLAKRWAEGSSIWPSALELIGNDPEAFATLDIRERVRKVLGNYMEAIRKRPVTVELIAAELVEPGEISRVLEEALAKPATEVNDYIRIGEGGAEVMEKVTRLNMVVSAVTAYITIRERNNPQYLGIPLNDETWRQLRDTIDELAEKFLHA